MKSKVTEDTPLIRQFFSVKAQYPEAVLLYRVGDFYETYAEDAVLASKVLGLVLTRKTNGEKGPVEMAGFPHHALDTYLPKLVRAGYKVAVCDQLEDPKFAKKLVKRGVTELVTPGVAFGDAMLEQKENNFLTGLYFDRDGIGAAFLDVSTGTFQVAQGREDYIATLLSSLHPREVVVPHGEEKRVRERFGDGWYISTAPEWAFVYEAATDRLCKQFGVDSLKGFAVDTHPLGLCAAGALLVYLEQTRHAGLKNICSLSRIDSDRFVWMDKFTFRNLEIFSAAGGGEGVSLVSVVDRCSSPMGARLLRNWLAMPVLDRQELSDRYDVVEHFTQAPEALADLQDRIGSIGDLERILSRAATGKIAPREVVQLGRGLAQTGPIRDLCCGRGVLPLEEMMAGMDGCEGLLADIRTTLAENPAAAIGKGDVIAPGFNAELDDLRAVAHGGRDYLLRMQERESERTGIPSLKIGFNNVFGYYIEVRNTFKDKAPAEWVRKQTLVSAERYITPELKEYEEKILGAEDSIYRLETELYAALVTRIQASIAAIQRNAAILARLDVLAGFADLALSNRYCRPVMEEGLSLDIKGGRHPVIETLMAPGEEYVPNDIHLDEKTQQIIILTGPNMAGKSALLRQTALIVLLAQIGSFVPADEAHIGWFDKIFTRVGATDNISRGESTFMVEMLETAMILHNLSARSLVLLDEIGRGTSTYDGMSIARAIVEYIHEYGRGAKTLFATHYHELNDLEAQYPRVRNFHIAVKEVGRQVIFLRKLVPGGTAHSFGIHVARMAGMPREVLESAEKTLRALEEADRGPVSELTASGEARREGDASGGTPPVTPGKGRSGKKEFGRIVKPYTIPEGTVHGDGSIQLSLFQLDDPTLSSLRDTLRTADLNNMTPLQAFDLLREMKKELGL